MNEKGKAARERLQAAQAAALEERREAERAARQALQRVLDAQDATTADILEATRLLAELRHI